MQYGLTDTQKDIQAAAREFAQKEFDPEQALELERDWTFPKSIFEKACTLGFIGMDCPDAYGGQSFGLFENILVTEEFCRGDSGIGIALSQTDVATRVILRHGDERQRQAFLPPLIQGKEIFATSIPALSGSGTLRGSPVRGGDPSGGSLRLEGKAVVVNGAAADSFLVFGKTADQPGLFGAIIQREAERIDALKLKKTMGMRLSPLAEISFGRVEVAGNQVFRSGKGEEGPWTTYLSVQRIKTSGQALGIAQKAFDLALKHSRERSQFGRKICQFEGLQFMMAELLIQIEAARSLVYRAAHDYDANSPEMGRISSIARLFSTDVAVRSAIDSIQIHGGVGLMKEYSIERMLRDAKTIQSIGENNLIQKTRISKSILP